MSPEVRVSERDVCDFCSAEEPVRIFSSPDFMLAKDAPPMKSEGGWAACAKCADLIIAADWSALRRRAIDSLAKKNPFMPRQLIEEQVVHAQRLFRAHMRGDA